jgi:hypothetical protein
MTLTVPLVGIAHQALPLLILLMALLCAMLELKTALIKRSLARREQKTQESGAHRASCQDAEPDGCAEAKEPRR